MEDELDQLMIESLERSAVSKHHIAKMFESLASVKRVVLEYVGSLRDVENDAPVPHQVTVSPFGSIISGVLSSTSDLDVCCEGLVKPFLASSASQIKKSTQKKRKRHPKLAPMYQGLLRLFRRRIDGNLTNLTRLTIPLIKLHDVRTGIDVDVTFENGLGIFKSHFLRACALADARSRQLILLVKNWAKKYVIPVYFTLWM